MAILIRIGLQSEEIGGIHVIAVITAKRRNTMTEVSETTSNPEENAAAPQPAAPKKPRVAAQTRNVARSRAKLGKKAAPAKKANTGAKSAKSRKHAIRARQGSKTAKFLDLLKRPSGATGAELMKASGWQAHSVRGFISGVLGKKMGLSITSSKIENGQRRYALKS
jgi:hypothetical protein